MAGNEGLHVRLQEGIYAAGGEEDRWIKKGKLFSIWK